MKTNLFLLAHTGQAKSLDDRDCLPNNWCFEWREKKGTAKCAEAGCLRVDSEINTKLRATLPNLSQVFAHNKNDSFCSADWNNQRLCAISPGALIPQALPYHLEGNMNRFLNTVWEAMS